jgi:ATP-dependent Clp protease ATP-binding subunit ClpC
MERISPATFAAWQLAAFEVIHVFRQRQIEKEHIFLGVTKLLDVPQEEFVLKLGVNKGAVPTLSGEIQRIKTIFNDLGMDYAELRRKFRSKLEVGTESPGLSTAHRSSECKHMFTNADSLRQRYAHKEVTLLHVLSSLFNELDNKVISFLKSENIDLKALQNRLRSELEKDKPRVRDAFPKSPFGQPPRKQAASVISKIGRDLTQMAKEEKISRAIGRDAEIKSIAQTLGRKKKNSAILIGDPGVGKTTVVEGLALKLVKGELTGEELKNLRIVEIRMGEIIAGTKFRGDLEDRLMKLLKEAEQDRNLIIFIDEIHTIMQAGGGQMTVGVGDILKPALQSGDFRCIGATTFKEYKKYIETDAALVRRFQPVIIKEPTRDETLEILSGLKASYEEHHSITIKEDAIRAAVDLSRRYLPDLFLPDKALDLLDEAASMLRIHSTDPKHSLGNVLEVQHIAEAVSKRKGIPVSVILCSDEERIRNLKEELNKRIIGQKDAVEEVSKAITEVKTLGGVKNKPFGVFLFAGATGTGKTEMAKAMAEILFGEGQGKLLVFDMPEYMEEHSVSRLIGAPPGYVGHEEGGQLVEQVKRNPYSVVLFDEIEKAHPKIFDSFLQIFDEARLTDGAGRRADFQNAFVILTSNVGSKIDIEAMKKPIGIQLEESQEKLPKENMFFDKKQFKNQVFAAIQARFRPEFIGRIPHRIIFNPLEPEDMKIIIKTVLLPRIASRFAAKKVKLSISEEACFFLIDKSDIRYGVRNMIQIMDTEITKPLTNGFVEKTFMEGDNIAISVTDGQLVFEKE